MPLNNSEKQENYRKRLQLKNPEQYEMVKKKNAERNKKQRKMKNYDETGKTEEKEKWRNRKKKHNDNVPVQAVVEENMQKNEDTNSSSENLETIVQKAKLAERRKVQRQWANESANYKDKIKIQKKKIHSLQKKVNRCQKQTEHLIETINQIKKKHEVLCQENILLKSGNRTPENLTPASKTNSFIEENLIDIPAEIKEKVKKQLFTHNVLMTSLQTAYESTTTDTERDFLKKTVNNDITRKYRSNSRMAKIIGLKGKIRRVIDHKAKGKRNARTMYQIKIFYERDDVSKATAGKKECTTFKGNKQQIRYLHTTLTELYKKYRNEGGIAKLTTFKKYRPFYVRRPKITDRNTCACVKHENVWLKCSKLKLMGMIQFDSIDPTKITNYCTSEFVCDMTSKDCAYGDCDICKNKKINLRWEGIDPTRNISWEEWLNYKHEYKDKSGKIKVTKKMVKSENNGTVQEFIDKFNDEMRKIKKHIYNIKHQYIQASKCLKSLMDTEVAMIIDFSENWVCKLATEVQSMHFGASKTQITIHTGVLYTKDQSPKSFATLSSNNEHGPEAIWAHLGPILDFIKNEYLNVTTIHFFSDGPSTQYRQKKNFYLFTKLTKELGFPHSTWNFSETSHGKGAADGVGAAIKRKLDNFVSYGMDIPNALVAFNTLKESDTSVMIHYISKDEIDKNELPAELKPIPLTMNVHQVTNTEVENVIGYRCLSCFCTRPVSCECLDLKTHLLLPLTNSEETDSSVKKNPQGVWKYTGKRPNKQVEAEAVHGNIKRKKQANLQKVKIQTKVKKVRKIDCNRISESSNSDEVVQYKEIDIDGFLFKKSDLIFTTGSFILDEKTGVLLKQIPTDSGTKTLNMDYTQNLEHITPNIPGPSRIKILDDRRIAEGIFVLVGFKVNTRIKKYYVGQVLAVNGINIRVKFMRKKRDGSFSWPQAEDISDVCTLDVTKVLNDPIQNRRGVLQFNDGFNHFKIY